VEASQIVWPAIAISPIGAVAGTRDLELTVVGTSFLAAMRRSQVIWVAKGHRTALATRFQSSTQLTATIPAALMATPVTALVFVETGDPMADSPPSSSDSVFFTVNPLPMAGAGAILVYGQTSTLPPMMKGSREISVDGSPWSVLREGHRLIYAPVTPGSHRLLLSNPCTGTHQPSVRDVSVAEGDTVVVTVPIPPDCE
jgi:hypothetical protein